MTGRIRGRRHFHDLRKHGRRRRVGAVEIRYLADETAGARIGYAIGKAHGSAVRRNRRRRQLRAIFAEMSRTVPTDLPPGRYLVVLHPTDASFQDLASWVKRVVGELGAGM